MEENILRMYSNRERKSIIDKINQLSQTEHLEILKIIRISDKQMSFTQNCNGIFLNFRSVSDHVVGQIDKFVHFCHDNKVKLDEYDQKINECKINNKIDLIIESSTGASIDSAKTKSQPLNAIIHKTHYKDNHEFEWIQNLKEVKQKERLDNIIDILENNMSKITKKKTCNMKFSNAKKKFARKVMVDKKYDTELVSCLNHESYTYKK